MTDTGAPQPHTTNLYSFDPHGTTVAWTVDDGTNAESIRRFALFVAESGVRVTLFPCGSYPGWAEHAALWRPLVASGQVQVGNHTWSHREFTDLTDDEIIEELTLNEEFFLEHYGVSTKPYFRPPNGSRDDRTDAAAARAGFTVQAMWSSLLVEGPTRTADELIESAGVAFHPGGIVIGHLNFDAMQDALPALLDAITTAGLRSVTIRDVFAA